VRKRPAHAFTGQPGTAGDGTRTGRQPHLAGAATWPTYRDLDATLAGIVQAAVMPKLIEDTPDELGALARTMSFYARLSPAQRQALDREHEAIYQRFGRPIRASTIAVLVTARRRDDLSGAKGLAKAGDAA
jgi:hypothetical protein